MTLSITTALAPTKKFLLDGEEFDFLTLNHLSDDDEARVIALLSRHTQLGTLIATEPNVDKCSAWVKSQKKTRVAIIAMLTTVPREKVASLHTGTQIEILDSLESLIGNDGTDEDGEDGVRDPGGARTDADDDI